MVKGTAVLRERNKRALLSNIRQLRETSRQELVKLMNVSKNTVSLIVDDLIKEQIIMEQGVNEPDQKGRPRIRIAFHPEGYRAIGFTINQYEIQYQIINYYGDVLESHHVVTENLPAAEVVNQVDEIIERLLAKYAKIIGIGIAVPGIIDTNNLKVLTSISMQWKDVSFKQLARFSVPIHVQNSVNMGALDVMNRNKLIGGQGVFYVRIGNGVGGAYTFKGQLVHGASWTAGEIGHLSIDPSKEQCRCGQHGCLEMLVKHRTMKEQMLKLNEPIVSRSETLLFSKEQFENEAVQHIMKQAGEYLGKALVQVIHLINPEYIVIDSSYNRFSQFISSCEQTIASNALSSTLGAASILFEEERSNLCRGAALFSIYHFEQAYDHL
ncbi:ROK family protein [Paenibacillus sp. GCM10027626]|uniref:ROK family protein n=1 Tax=Paenibacillus sp. GCM10027626 TaxID=3273411 RepID=UPI00363941E6